MLGSTLEVGFFSAFFHFGPGEVIRVRADQPLQSQSRTGLITGQNGGDDISHQKLADFMWSQCVKGLRGDGTG